MHSNQVDPWIKQWLSYPRFSRYLDECNGDPERALATYEWNLELGHAYLRDAGHFEVGLRNAYDWAITSRWPKDEHWLFDPSSPVNQPIWRTRRGKRFDVNTPNRIAISDAIRKIGNKPVTSDAVISRLPFGFRAHLSDAAYEQSTQIPYVFFAWPKGTSRSYVDRSIHRIATMRNRVAHNEVVFAATGSDSLLYAHDTILELLALLNPDIQSYVGATSKVKRTLQQKP